jgi:hypothetical protein
MQGLRGFRRFTLQRSFESSSDSPCHDLFKALAADWSGSRWLASKSKWLSPGVCCSFHVMRVRACCDRVCVSIRAYSQKMLAKHDLSKNGKLDMDELRVLLTNLDEQKRPPLPKDLL